MAEIITMGLSKIEVGTPAVDGDVATSFATLGYTDTDSCEITVDDPEETEVTAEEVDDPFYVMRKAGKTSITFNVLNPSVDTLVKVCGGTKGNSGEFEMPDTLPDIELSVKITPQTGFIGLFPRVSIVGKLSGKYAKSEPLKLTVTGTVLTPTKLGVPKATYTPITSA